MWFGVGVWGGGPTSGVATCPWGCNTEQWRLCALGGLGQRQMDASTGSTANRAFMGTGRGNRLGRFCRLAWRRHSVPTAKGSHARKAPGRGL